MSYGCGICERAMKQGVYATHLQSECNALYHDIALGQGVACPRCGFHRPTATRTEETPESTEAR